MSLGFPQGSILGPLFSSIFINDLPFVLNLHSKLFADDTTLYITFDLKNNSFDEVIKEFKNDLLPLIYWCKHNRLNVNWLKIFLMVISPKIKFDCQNS